MRHDNIRDLIAGILEILQHDVQNQPSLQRGSIRSIEKHGRWSEIGHQAKGF